MTQPFVSVIVPAYNSQATLATSLQSLIRQTYPDFEIIVIDSGPDRETEAIMLKDFPHVRFWRSPERLLPHAARNMGVSLAKGQVFVFTDPDIYAPTDWLTQLVSAYQKYQSVIVGSLNCYGSAWLENGMHLCKFDKWLPGGLARPIDIGPTANLLCDRVAFEAVGGFKPNLMLSDTLISWAWTAAGIPLTFIPEAVVEHHHMGSWRDLLNERWERGQEFGRLRIEYEKWSTARFGWQVIVTLLPLRLIGLLRRGAANAWQAKQLSKYCLTLPVVAAGQWAWLLGELAAYLHYLRTRKLHLSSGLAV